MSLRDYCLYSQGDAINPLPGHYGKLLWRGYDPMDQVLTLNKWPTDFDVPLKLVKPNESTNCCEPHRDSVNDLVNCII